jgi:TonB family protein
MIPMIRSCVVPLLIFSIVTACALTKGDSRSAAESAGLNEAELIETEGTAGGQEAAGSDAIYMLTDLDQKPKIVHQPAPELNNLLRSKTPGQVRIAFMIDRDGNVQDPYVQDSTDPVFELPALAAVKKWKFEPGMIDGRPVRVRMRVPITFPDDPLNPSRKPQVEKKQDTVFTPYWASRLSETELSLWNDPDFQKRFIDSYIAETEIEPRVTELERGQMEEVLELISADRMDEAADLLQSHRGEAASAVFDFTLANIFFQQEQFDQAAGAYGTAVDKYPKFRRAWRNLGLIHVRQNDFENSIKAFTRVIELGGSDSITYGLLGVAYANEGKHLPAESAFRMASLLDPETMDWKMGLAESFFKQERFSDASALCESLIAEDPDNPRFWLIQANAFIGLDQPLRAAENFELVDRLGGSTVDSLNSLGDIYVNEELFDLAVNAYIRAMEKDPQGSPARPIRAAKVLTARGAFRETLQIVERIESMHQDRLDMDQRKDLLRLRARLAVAEGAGAEEARVLEEIVTIDPLDGEALILLGQYYGRTGDPEKAVFYYERAAGIENFEADASVRHAQLLVGQGKYADALPLLRRAQMIKPRDNIQEYLEQVERAAQNR